MFRGKKSNDLIMKTDYKTLRAVYDTQTRSYEELLDLSGRNKIHTQNLQILMVEVYKCLNNLNSPFTWDYFKQKNNPCNLRTVQLLELSNCRAKSYGLNTALFKGGIFCGIINCQIILKKQIPCTVQN